jgi:pyruvate/2-oxoacid:ferredoxin oxidoreductase alpha subunit
VRRRAASHHDHGQHVRYGARGRRCHALRAALAGVAEVVVLDRNYSPGHGGVLHQELRAALYGMADAPRVHGYLAGVGGVNVSPARIAELARKASAAAAEADSVWVG